MSIGLNEWKENSRYTLALGKADRRYTTHTETVNDEPNWLKKNIGKSKHNFIWATYVVGRYVHECLGYMRVVYVSIDMALYKPIFGIINNQTAS